VISSKIKKNPQSQLQPATTSRYLWSPQPNCQSQYKRLQIQNMQEKSQLQSQMPFKTQHGLPTATHCHLQQALY